MLGCSTHLNGVRGGGPDMIVCERLDGGRIGDHHAAGSLLKVLCPQAPPVLGNWLGWKSPEQGFSKERYMVNLQEALQVRADLKGCPWAVWSPYRTRHVEQSGIVQNLVNPLVSPSGKPISGVMH